MRNARYVALKYENHASSRVPPRSQPKTGTMNMINEVKVLMSEYSRIINKLRTLSIDDDP